MVIIDWCSEIGNKFAALQPSRQAAQRFMDSMHPRLSLLLYALLVAATIVPGCNSGGNQGAAERILIHVGGSAVTAREFREMFEGGITSPSALYSDIEALRKERYRTLNRLTEELVILERARELSLAVSDEELALAENDFRKDFPDDTFEQTLIENGISYLAWEKGLRRRLLMEKVIRQDVSAESFRVPLPGDDVGTTGMDTHLEPQMPVGTENASGLRLGETPGTVSDPIDTTAGTDNPEGNADTDNPRALPENESESRYNAWMARLKEQYTIEIDWKLWEEIEQEDMGDM